ncbi:MAG: putative quinol monooxygenase [Brevinema sp.]
MDIQKKLKHVVVNITVNPEFFDQFIILSEAFVQEVRAESGNINYYLLKSLKNPYSYIFIGTWKDEDAFQFHMRSDHFARVVPQLGEFGEHLNTEMCESEY